MSDWDALVLHPDDDVAVALRDLPAGTRARVRCGDALAIITLAAPIALGHKCALRDLPAGATLRKYGEAIGATSADIAAGAHVHVHNLRSLRGRGAR
ncbi:MAG: D-galactarate dehydratase [Alphaproteobacteria bacterium]|nr:D-galactarate dehydratase [Alphaproteobacteria bacterium]